MAGLFSPVFASDGGALFDAITPVLRAVSGAGGIPSEEAFGAPTVLRGAVYAVSGAGGIPSEEAFGSPSLSVGGSYNVIDAGGIPSGEAFGLPVVSYAAAVSGAGGIPSEEAFGVPVLSANGTYNVIDAGGIASAEAFGLPTFTPTGAGAGTTDPAIAAAVAAILTKITDLHRIHGLDLSAPLVVASGSRTAGPITQTVTEVGDTVTVARV